MIKRTSGLVAGYRQFGGGQLELEPSEAGSAATYAALGSLGVVNAAHYGASPGASAATNTAAIHAARDVAGDAGGGIILLPPGVYEHNGILLNRSNVPLVSYGPGFFGGVADIAPAVTLKYMGEDENAVVVSSDDDSSAEKVVGTGLIGICSDANSRAENAVVIRSVNGSKFDFMAKGGTERQVFITTVSALSSARDPQDNDFYYINAIATGDADGVVAETATVGANISVNLFRFIRVLHANGVGLWWGNCDNTAVMDLVVQRTPAGTGRGVVLAAGDGIVSNGCRHNVFYHVGQGAGGILSQGTSSGAAPAVENTILYLDRENSGADPVIEEGSQLTWGSNKGVLLNQAFGPSYFSNTHSAALTTREDGSSTTTLTVHNSAQAHLSLTDGTNAWGVSVDSNGNLRFNRAAGSGRPQFLTAPLEVGSLALNTATIDTGGGLGTANGVRLLDCSDGNRQFTLPAANAMTPRSLVLALRRIDGSENTCTIAAAGTDTIDGGSTITLAVGEGAVFVSNGEDAWYSI